MRYGAAATTQQRPQPLGIRYVQSVSNTSRVVTLSRVLTSAWSRSYVDVDVFVAVLCGPAICGFARDSAGRTVTHTHGLLQTGHGRRLLSVDHGGLDRQAAWHLPGGPVGPPATWAARSPQAAPTLANQKRVANRRPPRLHYISAN